MEKAPKKNNSQLVLAIVLIALGFAWLIHKATPFLNLINIQLKTLLFPFRQLFTDWGHFIFSWQVILIVTGLILLAGKRSFGVVLIVLGGLFLVPKILLIPHLTVSFLIPFILISIGLALIARII